MTEASKEPKRPVDAGSEATSANTSEQPEEWVRRRVVPPPPDASDKPGEDRSPGGSGRGLGQPITPAPQPKVEQPKPVGKPVEEKLSDASESS
jgi:hypothetical protein